MSSPASSRSSSPSLESVPDDSDTESVQLELPTENDNIVASAASVESDVKCESVAIPASNEHDAVDNAPCTDPLDDSKIGAADTAAKEGALGAKHERYFFTADFITFSVRALSRYDDIPGLTFH